MPTLTGYTTMDPSPRVDVLIGAGEVSGSASTLTVFQSSVAGEFEVRGGSGLPAAGGAFVVDYEAPLGVEVTYFARQYAADGTLIGPTGTAAITLTFPAGMAVFSDPLAPRSAVQVQCLRGFAEELTPARRSSTYRVGRETITLMDQVSGFTGISLPVATFTSVDADALEALLDEGRVLVRTAPPMRVPRVLHVGVAAATQRALDFHNGGETVTWSMSGEQIAPSQVGIIVAPVTWQRYVNAFVTWQDMINAYPTWLDAIRNPPAEA